MAKYLEKAQFLSFFRPSGPCKSQSDYQPYGSIMHIHNNC